jgi:hypothetical protein
MNRPLFRANGGPASGGRSEAEIRSEIRELDQLVKNEVISQARADHDMKLLVRELQQAPLMMMDSVKKNKENLGRFLKGGAKGRLEKINKRESRFERDLLQDLINQQGVNRAEGGPVNGFPDLSGDGKVTQKDILMGRGVIAKQEGGPVMPQEAAGQVQMASEAEGQQVGLDYVAKTLGGIDNAEDVESMINAIRGNDMPIEARRTELAGFVGQDDAMATPESVLAMVQPTIMLSEEGAMNSGIGDLMQGMTSDIDMATEGGQPTDMGQGVGQLMMAGAPMDAAPQQFANGGAVQPVYMADAGDPSMMQLFQTALGNVENPTAPTRTTVDLESAYADYLPFFQNIAQVNEEDREKDRALALAKAGFQFASGRDSAGKNIAGSSMLSQLGTVGQDYVEDVGKLRTDARTQDRAVRTLAAQSAIEKQQAATAAQAALDLQTLKGQQALQEKNVGLLGDMIKQAQINNKVEVRTIKQPDGTEAIGVYNPADNSFKLVSDQTAASQYMMSLDSDGSMRAGISRNLIGFADGTLDGLDDGGRAKADMFTSISTLYAPKSGAEKGTVNPMPLTVAKAIVDRQKAGFELNLNGKIIDEAEYLMGNTGAALEQRMKDIQAEGAQTQQNIRAYVPAGADMEASFGAMSGLKRSLRFVNDQVRDFSEGLIGLDYGGEDPSNVVKSDTYLTTLQGETLKLRFADFGSAPRIKSIVDAIQAEVAGILPGAAKTDTKVLSVARALRGRLQNMEAELKGVLTARDSSNDEIKQARNLLKYDMPVLLESYENLINSLGESVEGDRDPGVPRLTTPTPGAVSTDAEDARKLIYGR